MVSKVSVLEIDVKDEKFKHFVDMFGKWQAATNKMPGEWAKIGKASEQATKQATKGFLEEAKALAMVTASLSNVIRSQNTITKNTRENNSVLRETARISGNIAKNFVSMSFQIGKMVALGGAIGGIFGGLGIGGIASAASNLRSQSQRAGVSPGQLRSARANIGVYGIDTDALLGNLNVAQHSFAQQGLLAQFGIRGAALDYSPGDNLTTLLPNMIAQFKRMKSSPEGFNAMHMGDLIDYQSMLQLSRLNPSEFQGMMSGYRSDVDKLGVNDNDLRENQRLKTVLDEAADRIETVFIKGLAPLAPQIEKLSGMLVKGFETAVNYLTSPQFKQDAQDFVNTMHKFAHPLDSASLGLSDFIWDKAHNIVSAGRAADVGTTATSRALKDQSLPGLARNKLLRDIMGIESSYGTDPRAYNPNATYKGPFQMSDSIFKAYGAGGDIMSVKDSSVAADKFLTALRTKYSNDMHKVVAGYNMGETSLDKIIKLHPSDWERYAPTETQDYIRKYELLQGNKQAVTAAGTPIVGSGGTVKVMIYNTTGGSTNVIASQLPQ